MITASLRGKSRLRTVLAVAVASGVVTVWASSTGADGTDAQGRSDSGASRFTTARGVRVVVSPEPGTHLVAITAAVRTSEAEAAARFPGVGGIVAKALFGSNSNLSREGVVREVHRAGGSVTTAWSSDCTAVTFVTTPAALSDAVWVLAQALKGAEMDTKVAASGIREQIAAAASHASDPVAVGVQTVRSRLFAGHAYGRSALGSPESLRRITRDDLLAYYGTAYAPGNTVVAIVGGVTLEQARRVTENHFVDYERRARARARRPQVAVGPPESPSLPGPTRSEVTTHAGTAAVVVGYRGPGLGDKRFAAFKVLATLIGGGKGSRLFRAVRDQKGIGYRLAAEVQADSDASAVFVFVELDPSLLGAQRLEDVEAMVVECAEGVRESASTAEELLRARRLAAGLHAQARERAADRAQALATAELLAGGWDRDEALRDEMGRVTPEQIAEAARAYLVNRSVAVVRPAAHGLTARPQGQPLIP